MKCFVVTHTPEDGAVFIEKENFYVHPGTCPDDAEATALLDAWQVEINDFRHCEACSDNGIQESSNDISYRPIEPESLLFDGGKCIGVFIKEVPGVLLFGTKSFLCVLTQDGYVGGWGDVTAGVSYALTEKGKKVP